MELTAKLDDYGKPAWIGVMVLGFIVFWPVGLAILAYLIWSGRMGFWKCGGAGRWHRAEAPRADLKDRRTALPAATLRLTSTAWRRCGTLRTKSPFVEGSNSSEKTNYFNNLEETSWRLFKE